MSSFLAYMAPLLGIYGLFAAWRIYNQIEEKPAGSDKMIAIAESIHEGAMVFLKREYNILKFFIGIVFGLLAIFINFWTGVAFLVGAGCSMLAGYFGMSAATKANVRTSQAATSEGQAEALNVAFSGGAVMGLSVASLGLQIGRASCRERV